MLLGFKKKFVPYILDGTKTHTIRAPRVNPPRVGELCHCYTGLRTKKAMVLGRWPCVKVEPITIDFEPHGIAYTLRLTIGDQTLTLDEADAFARRDGFRIGGLDEMAQYWLEQKRLTDELASVPWHGQVIHWAKT